MHIFLRIAFCLAVLLFSPYRGTAADNGVISRSIEAAKIDFGNFYWDRKNLIKLGTGVAGAAVSAHTGMDRYIRNKYQDDLRSKETDDITEIFNLSATELTIVLVSTYIVTKGAGLLFHNSTLEEWTHKSIRATVVGTPALLFLAPATGGDRPTEGDSKWRPFENIRGVSGHTYFSVVPIITAAKMSKNRYQKAIFYGLSTLPALSRINDDKHYFSSVALGWYIGYLSCAVVEKGTDQREGRMNFQLVPVPKGIAITVQKTY